MKIQRQWHSIVNVVIRFVVVKINLQGPDYPTQEKFSINIEIPQGYVVESYPKTIKIATIENTGLFAFDISVSGTKIQIQATTDIISARLSANYYRILKEFFQKVIDKQNEKIVLKKI